MPGPVNPSYVSVDMDLSFNSGSFGTPNWVVVNARDVDIDISFGEGDVSNRGSKLELKEPALQVRALEFDMVADETDTNFTAIRAAAMARTAVEMAAANGPIGTSGTSASGGTAGVVMSRCTYKVFGVKRGEPLNGAVTVKFSLKPSKQAQTNVPTDNVQIT
jgi:hypothetical protein